MSDDGWVQGCRYELQPAAQADRDAGYRTHLTPGTTWVLGSLTMNRSTDKAAYALRDNTLVRYTEAGKETTVLSDPSEYRQVATEIYGLPALPIEEALAVRAKLAARASGQSASR
jgi:arylamine N-acetyltransferase